MVDERVTGCDEALLTAVGKSQLDYQKAACGELPQRCTGAGPTEKLIRVAPMTGVCNPSLPMTAMETPSPTTGIARKLPDGAVHLKLESTMPPSWAKEK